MMQNSKKTFVEKLDGTYVDWFATRERIMQIYDAHEPSSITSNIIRYYFTDQDKDFVINILKHIVEYNIAQLTLPLEVHTIIELFLLQNPYAFKPMPKDINVVAISNHVRAALEREVQKGHYNEGKG